VTDPLLEDFRLWTPGSTTGDDTRARFTCVSKGGNYVGLLLRDIRMDVVRDGTGDWLATYDGPELGGRVFTARSDSHTGAILTLIARMCGLDGEIRGHLGEPNEEQHHA
jgi:hypothetical protein